MATFSSSWKSKRASGGKLPGSEARGVIGGADFLQKAASRAGYRMRGETLVVGGTSQAFEAALASFDCNAQKVTIVCPEAADQMRALPEEIARAEAAGVRVIHGWGPLRIESYRDGRVSGAYFKHCERAFDEAGAFKPVYDEANIMAQYCDDLVICD